MSKYEEEFWQYMNSTEWLYDLPIRQHKAIPKRRFSVDFAWLDAKVCVEVEGGFYTKGGHSRYGAPFPDAEKKNLLQLLGWIVIEAPAGWHVSDEVLGHLVEALQSRGLEVV